MKFLYYILFIMTWDDCRFFLKQFAIIAKSLLFHLKAYFLIKFGFPVALRCAILARKVSDFFVSPRP